MSKRHSAKYQARIRRSLTPPKGKAPVRTPYTGPPSARLLAYDRKQGEKTAELERLREQVRETLAND